jgi:hypothetical protein
MSPATGVRARAQPSALAQSLMQHTLNASWKNLDTLLTPPGLPPPLHGELEESRDATDLMRVTDSPTVCMLPPDGRVHKYTTGQ